MYNGYMALGGETLAEQTFELINDGRVGAYIETWNNQVRNGNQFGECIDWWKECDECPNADFLFTDGEGYFSPVSDPAPWYDPNIRDSDKFFGVVGLEVTGAEDSTRSATVQASVGGGGAVSRLRFGPREIVVRGLAVAADDCGLEVGLNWLRCQYEISVTDCGKDYLWYLDCCPNCLTDPNAPPVSPCWADNYAELANGPDDCPPDTWWPSTYKELMDGPNPNGLEPSPHPEWCTWVVIYRQLSVGLPEFGCDLNGCLVPYLRNFQSVRVIEGPIVLSRQSLNQGEIAEIEFTIACADPHEYTPQMVVVQETLAATQTIQDELPVNINNPFNPPRVIPRGPQPGGVSVPNDWERAEFPIPASGYPKRLQTTVPAITIVPEADMGVTRVGVWDDQDELIGGYVVPFIPAGGLVDVDAKARETITEYGGDTLVRNGFARSFKGTGSVQWPDMVTGEAYRVTVDQAVGAAVPFDVEVRAAEKGCA